MKKFLYISFVVLAVVLASCTKETIQPNAETSAAPVWKSSRTDGTPSFDPGTTTGTDENGITDPNNDEDQNRKRRNSH